MRAVYHTSTIADGNMAFRYGERSEVMTHRTNFLRNVGLPKDRSLVMDSPHKDIVTIIYDSETPKQFGLDRSVRADTLITQLPNTPLLLTTADCLPVTLYDPTTSTLGLMHLSRHTFCLDLIPKTTAVLRETFEVNTSDLEIFIGPHIHKDSYSFLLPLAETHEKLQPYMSFTDTTAHIDLTTAAVESFNKLGVRQACITVSPVDTYTSSEHFSHVRSVKQEEPERRLMTVAALVV